MFLYNNVLNFFVSHKSKLAIWTLVFRFSDLKKKCFLKFQLNYWWNKFYKISKKFEDSFILKTSSRTTGGPQSVAWKPVAQLRWPYDRKSLWLFSSDMLHYQAVFYPERYRPLVPCLLSKKGYFVHRTLECWFTLHTTCHIKYHALRSTPYFSHKCLVWCFCYINKCWMTF